MSEILDEDLMHQQRHRDRCKTIRFYTLLFSGSMAIIYLLADLLDIPYGRHFLIAGILAITLQTILCFLTARVKTWRSGIMALVAISVTAYIIWLYYWR